MIGLITAIGAAWSSAPLFMKFVAAVAAAAITAWFLVALTRLADWFQLRRRTPKSRSDGLSGDVERFGVRFGMPEDHAAESHLVWFHVSVDVIGRTPLERCDVHLERYPIQKDAPLVPLLWQSSTGARPEITLDPGKGLYYIPVTKRDEIEYRGHAFFCDRASYNNSGTWPPNFPPPGHNAKYRLLLRWSGGYARSYPFEINVPYEGVGNGKFYMRPLIDWCERD